MNFYNGSIHNATIGEFLYVVILFQLCDEKWDKAIELLGLEKGLAQSTWDHFDVSALRE
jgi:hypothetical protein